MTESIPVDVRLALAELAARYAVTVDLRDFDRLRDVFVPDCRLDTGRAVRDGIEAVVATMQGLHRYEATNHVLGQQLLEPDGGDVRGVTYCTAHHLLVGDADDDVDDPDGDGDGGRSDTVMHIRYHDRFVSTGAGWRIATRRLEVVWTDRRPVR